MPNKRMYSDKRDSVGGGAYNPRLNWQINANGKSMNGFRGSLRSYRVVLFNSVFAKATRNLILIIIITLQYAGGVPVLSGNAMRVVPLNGIMCLRLLISLLIID